jgi:hypothetical protein
LLIFIREFKGVKLPPARCKSSDTHDGFSGAERSARSMKMELLEDFYVEELKHILDAEKQLTKALPRMAQAAASPELKKAFRRACPGYRVADSAAERNLPAPRRASQAQKM